MSGDVVVGMITTPDHAAAEKIVNALVAERLIACGNISTDVSSIYRWQGAVERAAEVLVIMKTTETLVTRVVARVRDLHPYDVPEILFIPVTSGYDAYVQWVRDSLVSAQDTKG